MLAVLLTTWVASAQDRDFDRDIDRDDDDDEVEEVEQTRNLNFLQPAMFEDARPIPSGFQGDAAIAARPGVDTAGSELAIRPALRVGFGDRLSTSLTTQVALDEGQGEFGGVDLQGQWLFLEQDDDDLLPDMAVIASVGSPDADSDAALEGGLLITENIERTRLHLNGRYRTRFGAPDGWIAAAGADYLLGDRLLLLGDAYLQELEDDVFPGGDVGLSFRLGESFRLQGSAGLLSPDDGLRSQFVIGISTHSG